MIFSQIFKPDGMMVFCIEDFWVKYAIKQKLSPSFFKIMKNGPNFQPENFPELIFCI
jgi:hypothetical protein